ncbi:MAG: PAS domain-containing protein, partial [Bacteroidota bacterium]
EKTKRADELIIANNELAFQNEEKTKRADELITANKELAFQNEEKVKRAAELILANKEIAIQTALNLANAEKIELAELHQQASDRLQKIASMVPGVIYQYRRRPDGSSCFPYASEAIREIYRVSPEEVREDASKVFANLHPDDVDVVAASIQASAKDLTPWQQEYRVKFSDGTIRSLYGNSLPQREADGSVLWHGFITDVTDRLNAEKAAREADRLLRENNSRIDLAMQVANMAWWEMDVATGNVTYDKRKTDMLGYSHEKFTHYKDFTDLIHPEDYERTMDGMRLHFMGKVDKYEVEYRILTISGKYKWFYDIGSVVRWDSGGLPLYVRGLVLDITDRKQMEEDLKLASVRLELAARVGGFGVWDYDIVNNILIWDDQMFTLYGNNRKDFTGLYEGWQKTCHPDDKVRVENEIQMAIHGEKEFDTEFQVIWPDGSIHDIKAMAVVQRSAADVPLRMIGTNWDITSLRNTEKEKLDDSENRYRSIFQGSPDGIIIADPETKMIIFANPAQCQMLGYTEEELKMMKIGAIHPEETYQHFNPEFEKHAHGEKTPPFDIQCLKKNGEIFYADISTSILDMNGRQYIVGFFRDITERKHAEAIFEDIVEKNPLSIQIVDKDGYTISGNPEYIKLFGALPPPGFSIFADLQSRSPEFEKLILNAKSGEVVHLPDTYYNPKDISPDFPDSQVWIRALIFPLNDNAGKPERYVLMHMNITERKEAEVSLKKALVKAESGNRLKTAFMQNISHEVRTPLNGILGFGALLAEPDLPDREKQQYISLLQASSDRLVNTITDYMDISLILSDNIHVKYKSVDVMKVLTGVKKKFQALCAIKKLAFNLSTPEEKEPFCIQTDPDLFLKIITHILDNAIKFTHQGAITMGYSAGPAHVEFFCTDTGVGIEQEARERIFETFVQENATDTRGHEGSGLGLSIISGLTKLLGGEIRLESVKGQGTSFFFSLPISQEAPDKHESGKVSKAPSLPGGSVVLIAEDDLLNMMYIETILKKTASVIYKAVNGKEAVELCREHPEISLALMDIKMPVMSGLEATREIRKFNQDVVIIALTAYAHTGIEEEALAAGCNDYLTKPIEKAVLLALMDTCFKTNLSA